MVISNANLIDRRLSKRILFDTNLTVKSYTNGQEIVNAKIVNISAGGMQFFVPADNPKLHIHEICSFIFNLPELGSSYILGEIRYCRDFIDPHNGPVVHYGVKFINLPMQTWHHIKSHCQNETGIPLPNKEENHSIETQRTYQKTSTEKESLTAKTLALINTQVRLENGVTYHGKVKDINLGGIGLQLPESIPVKINLTVSLSFEEFQFTAFGICNECSPREQDITSFLVNISFNNIQQGQFENLNSLMMKLATYMADWILKSHDNLSK